MQYKVRGRLATSSRMQETSYIKKSLKNWSLETETKDQTMKNMKTKESNLVLEELRFITENSFIPIQHRAHIK